MKTDETYRSTVDKLVEWCDQTFLGINVAKTEEIITDFRRNKSSIVSLVIKGEEVHIVRQYKYLGTVIDNKLEWPINRCTSCRS